jgi:hypothetical protein
MFRLHASKGAGDAAQYLGHRQHAKRVARRRGIDDDQIESCASSRAANLEQARELVDARQRQAQEARDIVLVEPGAAQRYLLEGGTAASQPALERTTGIDFDGVEHAARTVYWTRHRGKRLTQSVSKRWGRIGRDEQRADASVRGSNRYRRRARRLPDSSFAADETKSR